MTVDEITS